MRPALLLCLLAVLALPAAAAQAWRRRPSPTSTAAPAPGCARPTNAERVKAATLCPLNAQRARVGAGPLTQNPKLQLAAERHSLDMATRKFFEHVNPEGVSDAARIIHTGYPPIFIGENLAWGEEQESTPAMIVKAWMNSPGHKANLMRPN